MTIGDWTKRIVAYWWITLITGAAFTLLLFPWSNETQYVSSITVGINFNDPGLSALQDSPSAYVDSFEPLSIYIEQRFSAIDIQGIIVDEAQLGITSLTNGKPFYDIENQSAGFINITYSSPDKAQSERFNQGVKVAYEKIISEWNESRQDEYRITPMKSFNESVVSVRKSIQFQLLPTISGIMLGIVLVTILPLPTFDKKKKK